MARKKSLKSSGSPPPSPPSKPPPSPSGAAAAHLGFELVHVGALFEARHHLFHLRPGLEAGRLLEAGEEARQLLRILLRAVVHALHLGGERVHDAGHALLVEPGERIVGVALGVVAAAAPPDLAPESAANRDGFLASSGLPHCGQAGRTAVSMRDEKKLKTVWQSGQ